MLKRALLISTADRYVTLLSSFFVTAVVSRIITPEEIGVSVVAMGFVGFAIAVREFASPNFLYPRQELSRDEVRAMFTLMLTLTLLISATLACTAPMLAAIYNEDGLIFYLRVISAALLIELLAAPIVLLLRRDMAFGRVALINVTTAVSATAVTVVLALSGYSYMSFALGWLASAILTSLMALFLSPQFWIFQPFFRNWRGMLVFGGYNGATNLFYKMYEALPYLVLGRVLSFDTAAIYSRSLMICQLPDKVFLAGAMSVALPAFARETRQGRHIKEPYLNALSLVTALQWPALLVLAVLAHPIVEILLGHQWHAVAPIVRIMAIAALFSFSFELNYPVLVSVGAMRDIFLRALLVWPISSALMVLAAFHSLRAAALSLLLAIPFQAFVSLQFVRRRIDIRWSEISASVWRSASVAAITVAGPLSVVAIVDSGFDMSIAEALIGAMLAAVGWYFGLWLTRHPMLDEILAIYKSLRERLTKGHPSDDGGELSAFRSGAPQQATDPS